jgi:hypothetical protein
MASSVYSQVLGDWENQMDGWAIWTGSPATTTYSTKGVTLHTRSLRLVNNGGWQFALIVKLQELGRVNDFFKNHLVSIDVTRLASEWTSQPTNGYSGVELIVNAGSGLGNVWQSLGAQGWWNYKDGDNTRTLTWDYSSAIPKIEQSTVSWCEFVLVTNHDPAYTGNAYYFDNARFVGVQTAYEPQPANNAKDVPTSLLMTWKPGSSVRSHVIFFGTDPNAVLNAKITSYPNVTMMMSDVTSYNPGPLTMNTRYYWRVDEVNQPNIWTGDVWNFTTGDFLVVDDFESYTDISPKRVFQTWLDGVGYSADQYFPVAYGGNGSGAAVGHDIWAAGSPYTNIMETTIRNSGSQSMPLSYDNSSANNKKKYSETERTFATTQNWTTAGVRALTIWFYGDPNNDAGTTEQLYVKVNGSKVVYDGSTTALKEAKWHPWSIDMAQFNVDLTAVQKIAIGVGKETNTTAGGKGILRIDDICLYLPRCVLAKRTAGFAKADYNPLGVVAGDCIVDYREMDIMATDWLAKDDVILTTKPAATGLVAYYPLNEATGTTTADASGNNHNGTLSPNAAWAVPGLFGAAAVNINGSAGCKVDIGTWDPTAGTGKLTLSLWVKWAGPHSGSDHQGLVGKRDTWAATGAMRFFFEISTSGGNNQLALRQYSGAATDVYSPSGTMTPFIGAWAHVAASFDGTTGRIYLNGKQIASGPFVLADKPDASMAIGNVHGTGYDGSTETYNGDIDEVRIYNRELPAGEIAYLADVTPDDGKLHVPVPSVAELYAGEAEGSRTINFRDFAILATYWLNEQLWP